MEVGHNSEATKRLFVGHIATIARHEAAMEEAKSKLRNAFKRAKADGFDPKIIKETRIFAMLSKAEQVDLHNKRVNYAKFIGAEAGKQMSLIDEFEAFSPKVDTDYFDDGWRVGAQGGNLVENPHDPSSDAGRLWIDGYRSAQDDILAGIKEIEASPVTEPEDPPTPKKRGRKPKVVVAEVDDAEADAAPQPPKKRGRPKMTEEEKLAAKEKRIADAKALGASSVPPDDDVMPTSDADNDDIPE